MCVERERELESVDGVVLKPLCVYVWRYVIGLGGPASDRDGNGRRDAVHVLPLVSVCLQSPHIIVTAGAVLAAVCIAGVTLILLRMLYAKTLCAVFYALCAHRIASWGNIKTEWRNRLGKSRQSHFFITGIVVRCIEYRADSGNSE